MFVVLVGGQKILRSQRMTCASAKFPFIPHMRHDPVYSSNRPGGEGRHDEKSKKEKIVYLCPASGPALPRTYRSEHSDAHITASRPRLPRTYSYRSEHSAGPVRIQEQNRTEHSDAHITASRPPAHIQLQKRAQRRTYHSVAHPRTAHTIRARNITRHALRRYVYAPGRVGRPSWKSPPRQGQGTGRASSAYSLVNMRQASFLHARSSAPRHLTPRALQAGEGVSKLPRRSRAYGRVEGCELNAVSVRCIRAIECSCDLGAA